MQSPTAFVRPGPVTVQTSYEFATLQKRIAEMIRAGEEVPDEFWKLEKVLLEQDGENWTAPLAPWGAKDVVFRRGQISRLSLSGRSFIHLGKSLFESLLPLRGVRLFAVKWYLEELAKCEHLGRLTRLDLSGNRIGTDGLKTLCKSPLFTHFSHLDLSQNDLCNEDLKRLPSEELRELRIGNNRLITFDFTLFPKLESLDLSGNRLQRLPEIPPNIRKLNLSGCGLEMLSTVDRVTDLDLSFNPRAKVTNLCHPNLKSLSLRGNRLQAASLANLKLPLVRHLDLAANFLGDAVVEWLTHADLYSLTSLDMRNVLLTDFGVKELCESGLLKRLHSLNLSWNEISKECAKRLANFRTLDMTGAQVCQLLV